MAYQINDVSKWVQHFRDVIAGKIPDNQNFYVVDTVKPKTIHQPQTNLMSCDIKQAVHRAKARLKQTKVIRSHTRSNKTAKVARRKKKIAPRKKQSPKAIKKKTPNKKKQSPKAIKRKAINKKRQSPKAIKKKPHRKLKRRTQLD